MRILPSQHEIAAITANPTPEGLRGYSIEQQLRTAVRSAVKPLAKRLAHYRSERARLAADCDRWSADAYNAKLDAIAARAHAGDLEAAAAIENGAVPSKQSYYEMSGRCWMALESFDRDSRVLFGEVLPLVEPPMTAVVDRGQAILDAVLQGVGVPPFELTGWRNHVGYIVKQLGHASRNESGDLAWFWLSVE
jgi:hypothetical protein